MPVREFANKRALIDYAEQNGLVYVWAFSIREQLVSPAFTKRQQMLSPGCAYASWREAGDAISEGGLASGVCG
jgi:hypothetical protein